jgi:hypothetical protein
MSRYILSRAANRDVPKSTVEFNVAAAIMPSAGNTLEFSFWSIDE